MSKILYQRRACPNCGSNQLEYLEDVVVYRPVIGYEIDTETGKPRILVDNTRYPPDFSGDSTNPRIACKDCGHVQLIPTQFITAESCSPDLYEPIEWVNDLNDIEEAL